ncbi:MAG: TauD/TfdA family dioxygenase [Gemmatimonadetes bacterium]|nr:TauD/TfdA family dioxygenase [Gemmatimonadota bacterium]MYG85571.1 TauD/TfdA family dioxygenase [Gemmatimonadota bacterium]MYJ89860.1 TauD/TfdA family dioxygenase [Gemmatimonadota bacterium]
MMDSFEVIPTGGALGAEVRGLDLRNELDGETVRVLCGAFLDHCVLFFRGQAISQEDLVRFTRYFGRPVPHVRPQPDRPIEEIFVISNVTEDGKPIGALGSEEIPFHSDLSYLPEPGTISLLYALEIPDEGGDTMWANGYASYEALDPDMKARIDGLNAVHRHSIDALNTPEPTMHPVVRIHPETGRNVIYVSPHLTHHIADMEQGSGQNLLDELIAHATDPRFIWRHRWAVGDLVMWDNRCTMHRRTPFDDRQRRVMWRTQVFGAGTR